eukprot:scaffold2992_cov214-Amphora_coffeaeformis.AAC.18
MLLPRLALFSGRPAPATSLQPLRWRGRAVSRRRELLRPQQQRSLALPGRIPPPLKSKGLPSTNTGKRERRLAEKTRWDPNSPLDRGPFSESFYKRHNSTILQPQFSGREAWVGLLGLSTLNILVLNLWNPEGFDDDAKTDRINNRKQQEWMSKHFTTNITNTFEGRVWTLATASISHQDFMHFAGNIFALWIFGFPTYRVIGTGAFYGLYLAGGVACSATHVVVSDTRKKGTAFWIDSHTFTVTYPRSRCCIRSNPAQLSNG